MYPPLVSLYSKGRFLLILSSAIALTTSKRVHGAFARIECIMHR